MTTEVGPVLALADPVQYVRLEELRLGGYQRQTDPAFVARLVRDWDDMLAGTLEVNRRGEGALYLVDGGHRRAAMLELGRSVWRAVIHEGLTERDEAALYRRLQSQRRKLAVYDDWRAAVVERDAPTMAITRTLDSYHYAVSRAGREPRTVAAIQALRDIYQWGGTALLRAVFDVTHEVWQDDRRGLEGRVLEGLGVFLHRHLNDPAFSVSDLHERLTVMPPAVLISRAMTIRAEAARTGGPGKDTRSSGYLALIDVYNVNRKRGRLVAQLR